MTKDGRARRRARASRPHAGELHRQILVGQRQSERIFAFERIVKTRIKGAVAPARTPPSLQRPCGGQGGRLDHALDPQFHSFGGGDDVERHCRRRRSTQFGHQRIDLIVGAAGIMVVNASRFTPAARHSIAA